MIIYRFAQQFIDIREKERKRGTRGLITIPQKTKLEEKLLTAAESSANDTIINDPNSTVTTTEMSKLGGVDNDDLLELQEKITKEILSSKLEEKEMQELQVFQLFIYLYVDEKLIRRVYLFQRLKSTKKY